MILIKRSSSYQLSHLYRLLYSQIIVEFFRSKGMFKSIDYSISGTTYYKGGVISIQIDMHTERAKQHTERMKTIGIATDRVSVSANIARMMSEQKRAIAMPNIKNVQRALEELHCQPWQDIDEMDVIDTRGLDTKGGVLYLVEQKLPRTRTLAIDITLHPDVASAQPELLPLFSHISCLIYDNCSPEMSASLGLYPEGTKGGQYKNGFTMPFTFKVNPHMHATINDHDSIENILSILLDCTQDFYKSRAFERYVSCLQHTRYAEDYFLLLPGPGAMLDDTGFFVGAKGWQKIATEENCKLLLQHMSIETKYGRERVKRSIASGPKNSS